MNNSPSFLGEEEELNGGDINQQKLQYGPKVMFLMGQAGLRAVRAAQSTCAPPSQGAGVGGPHRGQVSEN